MFPIKYIDNNLVWNKDNEVFAYYELIPYNYSFLSAEQKFIVHDRDVYKRQTLHDGYIEYTLLYDMIANRITIDEVLSLIHIWR